MRRSRLLAVLAIAVVAGLLVTGCERQMGLPQDPAPDANIAWHWVSPPEVFNLWAGQHTKAGTITVWSTEQKLYVRYDMAGNWRIEETSVHAALTWEGIPHNNGGPIPGRFEFRNTHIPPAQTYTYAIDVKPEWEDGLELSICAHAVAVQLNGSGGVIQRQTGWGGDEEFPGKNWAKYIKYKRQLNRKDVNLPDYYVTMYAEAGDLFGPAYNGGGASYWLVHLSGIGPGFDVWDGVWRGWCGEFDVNLTPNTYHQVRLWSSIDPGLPARVQDTAWDNINYLLNHKLTGATAFDVQLAVWALQGSLEGTEFEDSWYDDWPLAKQMYDEATLNGNGWYPGQGEWIAVILETPEKVQLCFIEVDP